MKFNKNIVFTELKTPLAPTPEEFARIQESIQLNGVAVVKNFLPNSLTEKISRDANLTCAHGYGIGPGLHIDAAQDPKTHEFRHPYLASRAANEYLFSDAFLKIMDDCLGRDRVIHNALFQYSLPQETMALDFHIDCGSIKALNGLKKFPDFRIRTILYLSDVKNGGFSYILNSHEEALKEFMPLPIGTLFPTEKYPTDPDRRVTVSEKAGTLILFNTHGLHRPEIPKDSRMVLNTWFAKKDFSAKLAPILFSLSFVPENKRDRLGVFDVNKNFKLEDYLDKNSSNGNNNGLFSKIRKKLWSNQSAPSNSSYYE